MFFTTLNDIINIWFNEGHLIIFFLNIFFLPFFLLLFIKNFYKIIFFRIKQFIKIDFINIIKEFYIELIFILIFISYIIGIIGLFQLKLILILDTIFKTIGIIFYLSGVILFYLFNKRHSEVNLTHLYNKGFYSVVRHPYYSILLFIASSYCLMVLSIITILLTILLFSLIIFKIKAIEKELEKKDTFFIDYKYSVPMLFPDIKKIFKRL